MPDGGYFPRNRVPFPLGAGCLWNFPRGKGIHKLWVPFAFTRAFRAQ